MATYVYEDEARTKEVLARNITERDKGVRYYCPNPKCQARMFLWNTEGESKSFFRSAGSPGHVENCPYGSENTYNPENTKEDGFDVDDVISNLMVATVSASKTNKAEPKEQGTGTADKEIVPHTIKQIYDMCKAHYCRDTFNNQVIGQILVDDRSIFMYPKGIYGSRFIEAKCRAKLYDGMNIYLETPIGAEKYQLKLKFQDANLFREIRDLLYNNRNHVIVVGGKWESSGEYNCFATEFNSKKANKGAETGNIGVIPRPVCYNMTIQVLIQKERGFMNILVIGNGFDLAHGLPTKYTDFLEFSMVMHQVVDVGVPNDKIDYGKLLPEMVKLIKEKMDVINKDEWKDLIYDNLWVKYFLWNPLYQKENWIDFESEIGRIIQSLDNDMFSAERKKHELADEMMNLSNEFLNKVYSKYLYVVQSMNALTDGKCESITFKEIRDRLYNDLNKLIRALEIYLAEYVGNISIKVISPDIQKIAKKIVECKDGKEAAIISNVLCFNYTNTYQRIYLAEDSLKNHIDYIHGKADISNTIETNNMVLGIDEYLPDERKNKETEFIAFKKFYQRIHKETGCKYKEWVDDIREEYEEYWQRRADAVEREHRYTNDSMQRMMNRLAASAIKDERCRMHNLYIFGHSLDVTDRDILRDLILNDNVYTTIYYLNKDVMGQQIANLVKVIGQDELIRRTGGSTKTIEFRKQQDMVES